MNGKSATKLWECFIIWLLKQTAKINSFLMKNIRQKIKIRLLIFHGTN